MPTNRKRPKRASVRPGAALYQVLVDGKPVAVKGEVVLPESVAWPAMMAACTSSRLASLVELKRTDGTRLAQLQKATIDIEEVA